MADIQSVKLELLRLGPAHNQLLSPLTPYLALCGAEGPVRVTIPFEHRQLLSRLERLRYVVESGPIPAQQREAEVRDIGEALGRVLGDVPALLSELGNARAEGGKLVHLRLSLSAFELGLVPFELAIAPDGFPGSGSALFLQSRAPVTVTREIRRGRPLSFRWDRAPRILFAFASPAGLPPVPAADHLRALRRALDPWVEWAPTPEERVEKVKQVLTVLEDATLEQIRDACATTEYTHVHLLAHGARFPHAGDARYGVALCSETSAAEHDVVEGERLAIALTARDSSGITRHRPTVVTLATCDSGNVNTVLTPGGSIAHELHSAGIPWVVASQFPLWMRSSSIAAEVLYAGFLRGVDPRWVLYELRQRLRTDSPGTHDWASMVAYATVPWDFQEDVEAFRIRQTRNRIEVKFKRADGIVAEYLKVADKPPKDPAFDALIQSIRDDLTAWRSELGDRAPARARAERLGTTGACEKRIGILYYLFGDAKAGKAAYEASRDYYRSGLEVEPFNHWVITQYLCMLATPVITAEEGVGTLAGQYGEFWVAARHMAQSELRKASGRDQAWPLSSLAELTMLGLVYGGQAVNPDKARADVVGYCRTLRELMGPSAFPVCATRRQFERYANFWRRRQWQELAADAVRALGDEAGAGRA